jgi:hypothetical protein
MHAVQLARLPRFGSLVGSKSSSGVNAEATARAGVSRAYYAAFCYARNFARDYLGFTPHNDTTDHGRLRAALLQRRRSATSKKLERLRDFRNECDYLDNLTMDAKTMLSLALKEADYVFQSLPPPQTP